MAMAKVPFASEADVERKLRAYLKHCTEPPRLPNVAGFCRFCHVKRSDFLALREQFPVAFDVALSTFMDEALNCKAANPASTMSFLLEQIASQEESGKPTLQIICAQDVDEDGA